MNNAEEEKVFVSYEFVVFLLALLTVYYLIPKRFQWMLLLIANFVFYYSAGPYACILILVTSVTVYLAGIIMGKLDGRIEAYNQRIKSGEIPKTSREEKKQYKEKINRKKKACMIACLLLNLGILAVLKYTNFIIENVNVVMDAAGKDGFAFKDFILPLGISFYTFQAVGYLLDVYWGKCEPQKKLPRFVLFVSFFPQLIQGPISRYSDLSKTLYEKHYFDWRQVRFGLERILWGYFKKLVVADRISVVVANIMGEPDYYTGAYVLLGMLFYAAQLYADFTGGIDITIGIAQALGIKVEENFIRPFFSKNITEYWRRWHISMGTWFRDYVFYPCSLSKGVKNTTLFCKKRFGMVVARRIAVYISTLVTWFTTGIWHGADWHFIVWGLVNGVIILISEEFTPLYEKFHKRYPKLVQTVFFKAFQVARTFLLLCCIRLFDTYGSVRVSIRQFVHMFTKFDLQKVNKHEILELGLSKQGYIVFFIGVLAMFCVSMLGRKKSVREQISELPYIIRFGIYVLLFFVVLLFGAYGIGFDAQQFIYNQF